MGLNSSLIVGVGTKRGRRPGGRHFVDELHSPQPAVLSKNWLRFANWGVRAGDLLFAALSLGSFA